MRHNFMTRRTALRTIAAGTAAGGIGASANMAKAGAAPAASNPDGVCVLFPHSVEGPYYIDPKLVRSDITAGRPGLAVEMRLRVIELGSCKPMANTRVDVWHADAGGVYSGYANQGDARNVSSKGEAYLRGTQITDVEGFATFRTVYPGWYPGRTPHIHVKVFLDSTTVLTGQIYFPDTVSAGIYRTHPAYVARPVADTSNTADFLFKSGGKDGGGTVLTIDEGREPLLASLVIAVDRSGEAARKAGGWRDLLDRLTGRGA